MHLDHADQQTLHSYFYSVQKAGRSGRFVIYAMMMWFGRIRSNGLRNGLNVGNSNVYCHSCPLSLQLWLTWSFGGVRRGKNTVFQHSNLFRKEKLQLNFRVDVGLNLDTLTV